MTIKNIIIYFSIFQLFVFINYPVFAQGINNINLSELICEYNSYSITNSDDVHWNNVKILFILEYEGSDIPRAYMLFLSNSIMVLKSKFYSENYQILENRFFKYSLSNNQAKLISIDSRYNIPNWLDGELYHKKNFIGIISVDEEEASVTYDFLRRIIRFGGLAFWPIENRFRLII